MESLTGAVLSAVTSAHWTTFLYANRLEKLTETEKNDLYSALDALSGFIIASHDLVKCAERYRNHYATPPEPIGGISAASYHELGRDLASFVEIGFDLWLRGKPMSRLIQLGFPVHFDCSWLVARIQHEAGRADLAAKQERSEGTGKTAGQSAVTSGAAREAVLRDLKPSVRKAYLAFQYAETMNERRLEDRDAYNWLRDNGIDQGKGDLGELTDYEPRLSFATWGRQVREARGRLGEQKHTRRAGRAAGSSIVRRDEIEYQKGDEE